MNVRKFVILLALLILFTFSAGAADLTLEIGGNPVTRNVRLATAADAPPRAGALDIQLNPWWVSWEVKPSNSAADGPVVELDYDSSNKFAAACKIVPKNPGTVTVTATETLDFRYKIKDVWGNYNWQTLGNQKVTLGSWTVTVLGPRYNVTLHAEGAPDVEIAVQQGGTYGANRALPDAVRDGCEFDGWFTEPEGGERVSNNTTVSKAEPHDLYAHWKEKLAITGAALIDLGKSARLEALVTPVVLHPTLSWSGSGDGVLEVGELSGEVRALKPGKETVNLRSKNGAAAAHTVTVQITPEVECTQQGDGVSLSVSIPANSTVAGGSFELLYDSDLLKLESSEKGGLLADGFLSICPGDGKLRVSFASKKALVEAGSLLTASFAGTGEPAVTNVHFIDENGSTLPTAYAAAVLPPVKPGAVTAPVIRAEERENGIEIQFLLPRDTGAAGACLELAYDPGKLTLESAGAGSLANFGYSSVNRKADSIRLSFAAAKPLRAGGVLLNARFTGRMPQESEISLRELTLFDGDGVSIPVGSVGWDTGAAKPEPMLFELGITREGEAVRVDVNGEAVPQGAQIVLASYRQGKQTAIQIRPAGTLVTFESVPAEWDRVRAFLVSARWVPLCPSASLDR